MQHAQWRGAQSAGNTGWVGRTDFNFNLFKEAKKSRFLHKESWYKKRENISASSNDQRIYRISLGEEQLEAKIKRKSVASKESSFFANRCFISIFSIFIIFIMILLNFAIFYPQVNKLMDETERQLKTIAMLTDDHQQASKMTKR